MLKLGYLPLVKGSWLNEKQVNTKNESVKQLKQLATVIETGKLIVSETDADEACALFAKENIDALVVHHLAFP